MLKYIKHHVDTISGVEIYPIISLLLFFMVFTTMLIIVLKMPKKNIEELKKGDGENDCCICLETLQKNDRCVDCQQCKNLFHSACIRFWLNKKRKCPLCRTEIETESIRIIV